MAEDNKIIAEIVVEGLDRAKAVLREAAGEVKNIDDVVKKYAQTAAEGKKKIDELVVSNKATASSMREVGESALSLETDIKRSTVQLAELVRENKIGQTEALKYAEAIGEMKRSLNNARNAVKELSDENLGLKALTQGIRTLTGAMEIGAGVSALLGSSNEKLEKSLIKLNAIMAISSGIRETVNTLTEESALKTYVLTRAQTLYNVVVGNSTGMLKLFRIALAGTGIGVAIFLVYELAKAFGIFNDATDESVNKTKELKTATEQLAEAQEQLNDRVLTYIKYQENTGQITTRQSLQEQLTQALQNQADAQDNVNTQLQAYNNILDSASRLGPTEYKKQLDASLKSLQGAQELYNKNTDEVNRLNKEIKQLDESQKKVSKSSEKVEEQFGGVNREFQRQRPLMQEAIDLFNEYGRVQARTAGQAEAAAKRIAEAQKILQDSVSGGNVERAVGSKQQVDIIQQAFEKAQGYYSEIQNAIGNTSSLIQNATQIRAEQEIQALEKKRQRGLISEKQYEKEIAKIKNEQAQKQRRADTINAFAMIPMAILSAFTNTQGGLVIKGIAAGIAGAFATAQAALVAAAPLPKFRDGGSVAKKLGLIKGKSHEAGGVPIEVEGDEFVMSKKAVKHYGVDFMEKVNKMKLSPVVTMAPKIEAMQKSDYKMYEHLATLGSYMKQDYKTGEKAVTVLHEINSNIRASRRRYV